MIGVFGEMVVKRGGLAAIQSLLTIKRGLVLSISNRISCFWSFYNSKWPSQDIDQMYFRIIQGARIVPCIHPLMTLSLKRATRTFDYELNEPPPKLIWSSFLYTPYKSPGHNLQLLSWGLWRCCHPQTIVLRAVRGCHSQKYNLWTFQLRWTKWLSQNCIGCVGERVGVVEVLVAFQSLSTSK